jgi:hypothetical protein
LFQQQKADLLLYPGTKEQTPASKNGTGKQTGPGGAISRN